MTIRDANPDDAEELVAYVHRMDAEMDSMLPRAPGEFLMTAAEERTLLDEDAASDNSVYLVAEVDGRLVGRLSCTGGKRLATRHNADFGMSVAQEWRGQRRYFQYGRFFDGILMARLLFALAITFLAAGVTKTQAAPPPGYTPIWSDDFAQEVGAAPDPARWKFNLGSNNGWGNHESDGRQAL